MDLATLASFEIDSLENAITEYEAEEHIATQRVEVATRNLETIRAGVRNRERTLSAMTERLETLDEKIAVKYASKSFWEFLFDMGKAVAGVYGGEVGSKLAGKVFEPIKDAFRDTFNQEREGRAGSSEEERDETREAVGSFLKEVLVEPFSSAAVKKEAKKKFKETASYVWDVLNGDTPPKSGLDPEIERIVSLQSQSQITLDYQDLLMTERKAKAELELAKMEQSLVRSRQRNARLLANKMRHYVNYGSELSVFDRVLMGRQAYEQSIELLETLTKLYGQILRQAEYEFLTFSPIDGQSLLPLITSEDLNFNLRNYVDMVVRLEALDRDISTFTGSQHSYYHRWEGNAFEPAEPHIVAGFSGLGISEALLPEPMLITFKVDHDDIESHPALGTMRKRRIRDIRLRLFTATGGEYISVTAVRDSFDTFLVGKPDAESSWVADFELVLRDINPDGSVRSPLHYQTLRGCVDAAPGCDLADPLCRTSFQEQPFHDSCNLSPGDDTVDTNTFFDRSLIGKWSFVVPAATLEAYGEILGVEVVFILTAEDL